MKQFLNATEKEQIEHRITELERNSSGEIVVYVAKASHSYKSAVFTAALIGFFVMNLLLFYAYFTQWGDFTREYLLFFGIQNLIGAIVAGVIAWFSPILRTKLVFKDKVEELVLTKAKDVFLNYDLFNTVDRTGVLIYISILEHKVMVLGDVGISEKINEQAWETLLQDVVRGIKDKKAAKGILQAIADCEKILLDHGFEVKPDTINELPNHVIVEE